MRRNNLKLNPPPEVFIGTANVAGSPVGRLKGAAREVQFREPGTFFNVQHPHNQYQQ
jgi:hypothetical protein